MGLLPGGTDLGPGGAVCLRHAAGTRRRTGPGQETEPKGTEASAGNTVDMGDYVLTLPKDCTQQAREDGGLSFLCDGAPVGGVQTLDCPGADQVDWDDLTGYKEVLPTLWSQFLEEGEGTPDYIASPAAGSGADLEVSLVTDQRSESHYLFCRRGPGLRSLVQRSQPLALL